MTLEKEIEALKREISKIEDKIYDLEQEKDALFEECIA